MTWYIYLWFLIQKNNICYTTPFTDLVIWGCKMYIINSKQGKSHWTHAPTQIHVPVFLPWTLPFYLQVKMDYSWDIPITPRSLYNFTLRLAAPRQLFIDTLMIMMLNYTQKNPFLLVPLCFKNILLEYTNQAIRILIQRSVWFNLTWAFQIHHFPLQSS